MISCRNFAAMSPTADLSYVQLLSASPDWQSLAQADRYSSIFILTDNNTQEHCLPLLQDAFPAAIHLHIPAGEKEKNIETCSYLWQEMLMHNADRQALLINLGGGVIGDMGGFVAGTYKRGINFIQIPTTLLSMVDASVGGKLGIDHHGLKNVVGLFRQPQAVLIYPEFLKTLPERELFSGYAEVLKHGLIADAAYWNETAAGLPDADKWSDIIRRSVMIKQEVVEDDPLENGRRKILNFGHTVGHALETWSLLHDEDPLLHGEAIARGMVIEAALSRELTGLSTEEEHHITTAMMRFFPEKKSAANATELLHLMMNDKKNTKGEIRFSLLGSIGHCRWDIPVPADVLLSTLQRFGHA